MNIKYLEKLEYNLIKEKLASFCKTYLGKNKALRLEPDIYPNLVQRNLDETNAILELSNRLGKLPISNIDDLSETLKRIESQSSLTSLGLLQMLDVLMNSRELFAFYTKAKEDNLLSTDILDDYFLELYSNDSIEKRINNVIISENEISDNASPALNKIRKEKKNLEIDIRNRLNDIVHSNTYSKYIQDKVVTIRNGRFVIPVMNEYRSMIKGFIHDLSSSGQTVYIEPTAVFEANNRINELEIDEVREIERILEELSTLLFPIFGFLKQNIELISNIDFLNAKALLSDELDASKPVISNYIFLKKARHPLIDKNKVVPISLYIGKIDEVKADFSTLVITGPNTGGKTVTLKTVGLLVLMAQSGLNITCQEGSTIKVFDNVFADIGDDQSIAESLSTFSSHMTNIAYILSNMTQDSLVLVDELGSGTDPLEGANLAISLLEKFHEIGAFTLATTHYHEIKDFCYVTDGYYNCSLEFDLKTLRPTYNLLMGIPGKSNAFEISRKLGIPQDVILNAKSLLDKPAIDSEQLFKEIYDDRVEIAKEKIQIEKNLNQVTLLRKKLEDENNNKLKIEEEKIENAKIQARQILIDAKDEADKMIRELNKISLSDNNKRQLENLRTKMNEKINKTEGSKLDFSNLSLLNNKYKTTQEKTSRKGNISLNNTKAMTTSTEINIIGETVADGIEALDKYLDNCKMANLKIVRVVHGKGTGKLRQGVHDYLKKSKYVKSFRIASIGEGDYGVTIVELK